jgi:hypothetical protein
MNVFIFLTDAFQIEGAVMVRVAYPVLTEAFKDSTVLTPHHRSILQGMVRGTVMNGAPSRSITCLRKMNIPQLPEICAFAVMAGSPIPRALILLQINHWFSPRKI